jgi:hypothetical protein
MRRAARSALADECTPAAWLCVCCLEPLHLARLEARGAPVRALAHDGAFVDAHEGVLTGGEWALAYTVPTMADLCGALEALVESATTAEGRTGAEALGGPVVQDAPSKLAAFAPIVQVWSPGSHEGFPRAAQQRARELLWIGAAMAKAARLGFLPLELFVALVMPLVLQRRSCPGGVGEAGKLLPLRGLRAGLVAPSCEHREAPPDVL